MNTVEKVAIIGAGCSGLTAIKCCLDEGMEPCCYEKDYELGGLWRFEKDGVKDGASVYKTTVINSSKETLSYSDFPIPKEYPNFMHHLKVMDYLKSYADEFDLRKYINFNSELVSCVRANDFKRTGRWVLTVKNTKSGETFEKTFDAVMICIGHHAEPYYPLKEFPGVDKFMGTKIHSRSYRDSTPYEDKKVTIVGTGNSGCDMAVELSRNAEQVYLSTRRGAWVFNRIMDTGIPFDLLVITRFKSWLMNNIPSIMNPLFESVLNNRFDHKKYGIKPKHRVLSQHPTINDELPNRIVNGTVILKGNITGFTENEVIFSDGSKEQMDVVIFATGYSFDFPFIEKDILDISNHESNLFRLVWPMNLERNTLAVIGLVQPLGVIAPCSELQSRWATRVFKGFLELPSNREMLAEYNEMMNEMKSRYLGSHRHTIEVDGVRYMDSIAKAISCKPSLWKMLVTDPLLAWEVYVGPFTCAQYRLTGPGKWKGARHTIMTQWDRVWYPMSKGNIKKSWGLIHLLVLLLACLVALVLFKTI